MAAFQRWARIFARVWRTLARLRESTGQIWVARPLLATRFTQRGCVSQMISARGNELRKPETAGNVWTISPREPRRTARKRGSDMRGLADSIEKRARGMVFGVADDGYADAEAGRGGALRGGGGRGGGSLGGGRGEQIFAEVLDVEFGENY